MPRCEQIYTFFHLYLPVCGRRVYASHVHSLAQRHHLVYNTFSQDMSLLFFISLITVAGYTSDNNDVYTLYIKSFCTLKSPFTNNCLAIFANNLTLALSR